ncbi:MAG TPA: inositol monophosphatase [Opitutaceae bacterium]|nr:inositol monophosphatase [Opitutaceae bacterium]
MSSPSPEIASRIEAARSAVLAETGLLHREFGRAESRWKGDGTRVTAVDIAISENIFRSLHSKFAGDQLFSEELPDGAPIAVTARFAWVLDPIDGTNNFALGIPHCAISLALVEHGEPVYGVVYDLGRRVLMHGGPGFGMHDGERLARVSTEEPHPETLIGIHSPSDKSLMPSADAVLSQFKIRGLGSATLHLAYVAAGFFGGAVDFNVKIWDLAAAIPLCRAAGGQVIFISGEPLPMRVFDLKMKPIVYVAGAPAMARRLAGLVSAR